MPQHTSGTTAVPAIRLAWVGAPFGAECALPCAVTLFEDSDDFLLAAAPFDFDVFVIRSAQRGVGGIDLVRIVRRRSASGILALCDQLSADFVPYLDQGADVVLGADVPVDHLRAAIGALARRAAAHNGRTESGTWKLLASQAKLETPDGTAIPLSEADLTILQCFAANGGKAEREKLIEQLWGSEAGPMDNALHATVYRLRKRIEQAGQTRAPLQAVSKVGYEFRAPLVVWSGIQAAPPDEVSNIRRKRR